MITNLRGRIKNTHLPKSNANLALFEVIVNSIHAIDERIDSLKDISISEGRINVSVLREALLQDEKGDLLGFEISDNGIGFNSNNYNSFNTLDSDYKVNLGCHGVGRLVWLKVFKEVTITSNYCEDGHWFIRSFVFSESGISSNSPQASTERSHKTTIRLCHIRDNYKGAFPVKAGTIAKQALEHCMWFFMRDGSAPNIFVEDGEESICLNREFETHMLSSSQADAFYLKGHQFFVTHVKYRHNRENAHWLYYCAANRIVREQRLNGKVPGLFDDLFDSTCEQNFYYCCFVTSDFLTEAVNETRTDFNMAEINEGVFADSDEITFDEIEREVFAKITTFLSPFVAANLEAGKNVVEKFVSEKAPRYKSILKRIPESDLAINPKISDKELELKLHSHLMTVEAELIAEGHDLMKPIMGDAEDDYLYRIHSYLDKAGDLKQSDLANYVTHRKVIIDLFKDALKIKNNGKYSKEEVIHQLVMPMQKDSEQILSEDANLWLIDEKLAFHSYLASDKTLRSMPISDSTSTKEPDLCAINIYDNPLLINEGDSVPLASLTVVEIKRPMRNDAASGEEKDPIEQVLGYVRRIRQGSVLTKDGRPIPHAEDIPAFCYVLCDLTPTVIDRCKVHDFTLTSDKMGYFGYKTSFNAYVEVISFDRLVNQAAQRNRAFFDKLGIPTT